MDTVYSAKRKKLPLASEVHPDTFSPKIVTPSAHIKYRHMRHNLVPGVITSFNKFPEILDKIRSVGWECMVSFSDKQIYPALIAEFYSHMTFIHDINGNLTGIATILEGQEYVITELLILHALNLGNSMLELARINDYTHPIGTSTNQCAIFKYNLSTVTEQIVPALLFDMPSKISIDFLTTKCQFLGKLFRTNIMPIRDDKMLYPFDLELMKCILTQNMTYNLPHLILTCFELCYHNNCLGFGLLLTPIFKQLGINVLTHHTQLVPSSNIVSHLANPPRPLIVFKPTEPEYNETNLNLSSQVDTLHSMMHLSLQNQSVMLAQIETLQLTVHHLRDMLYVCMENQKISIPPFNFSASTSSAKPETPSDPPLPNFGPLFSSPPLNEY